MSLEFKYFITATFFGHIFIWKASMHRKLIHSFNGHTRTVCSLSSHPTQSTLFISVSTDCTARIWCLDKFTELYSFTLPSGVTNIKMLDESIFAAFYNNTIKIGKLNHLALSFNNSKSRIISIGKC